MGKNLRLLVLTILMGLLVSDVLAKNQTEIESRLIELIQENKQTELKNYLKKKISTRVKDKALRLAVEKNRVKIACMLIINGANPRVKDKNGLTSLMIATINNYSSMVQLLMKMEGGLTIKDNNGNYAVTYAIRNNNTEVFNILSNFKPGESHKNQHLADILVSTLELNRPEMAKILISKRFHWIPNDGIEKALKIANQKGYFDVIRLLKEKGIDVNVVDSNSHE